VDEIARLVWTKRFGYIWIAALVGTSCQYKFAGVGVLPYAIVGIGGAVVMVWARAWTWASGPPKPGEFR
jgi:uncharacterized protein (DUF697 family)